MLRQRSEVISMRKADKKYRLEVYCVDKFSSDRNYEEAEIFYSDSIRRLQNKFSRLAYDDNDSLVTKYFHCIVKYYDNQTNELLHNEVIY